MNTKHMRQADAAGRRRAEADSGLLPRDARELLSVRARVACARAPNLVVSLFLLDLLLLILDVGVGGCLRVERRRVRGGDTGRGVGRRERDLFYTGPVSSIRNIMNTVSRDMASCLRLIMIMRSHNLSQHCEM